MSSDFSSLARVYRDPYSMQALREKEGYWMGSDGRNFPLIWFKGKSIPVFTAVDSESNPDAVGMYSDQHAANTYRNFLNWLFATFTEDELSFRQDLVSRLRLRSGDRLLITGCGLGDDIIQVLNSSALEVQIFASDLSIAMVLHAAEFLEGLGTVRSDSVSFSVADACRLPFADNTFDAAFHFGGINLFRDPNLGISEMTRVVKNGGRVVFGDEGVAPWLKGTDYADMVVANNPLWAADSLINQLPLSAVNVKISWVLGNCFYVIEYDKRTEGPRINPDVQHVGYKGGTMRTRYYGRIEGISPALKERLYSYARRKGRSVHSIVEAAIASELKRDPD